MCLLFVTGLPSPCTSQQLLNGKHPFHLDLHVLFQKSLFAVSTDKFHWFLYCRLQEDDWNHKEERSKTGKERCKKKGAVNKTIIALSGGIFSWLLLIQNLAAFKKQSRRRKKKSQKPYCSTVYQCFRQFENQRKSSTFAVQCWKRQNITRCANNYSNCLTAELIL